MRPGAALGELVPAGCDQGAAARASRREQGTEHAWIVPVERRSEPQRVRYLSARGWRCRMSTHLITAPPPGHRKPAESRLARHVGTRPSLREELEAMPLRAPGRCHGRLGSAGSRYCRRPRGARPASFRRAPPSGAILCRCRGDVHDSVRVCNSMARRQQDRDRSALLDDEVRRPIREGGRRSRVWLDLGWARADSQRDFPARHERGVQALELRPGRRRLRE